MPKLAATVMLGCLLSASTASAATHLGPVTDIAVDGDAIYSVSQGGVFLGVGEELKLVHRPGFRAMCVAASGRHMVFAGGTPGVNGEVGWLDLKTGATERTQLGRDLVYDVDLRGDLAALALADGRIMTVRIPGLEKSSLRTIHRHAAAARAVAFSKDGEVLASGGLDSLVVLSPLKPGAQKIQMQDHTDKVDCLVFSPDGKQIASGARDGKVRIHNLDGRLVRTYLGIADESTEATWDDQPDIFSLAWGGNPIRLRAGTGRNRVYELSLANNQWRLMTSSFQQPIYSLAFDKKGRLLVGTHDVTAH